MLRMARRRTFYLLSFSPFTAYDNPDKSQTAKSFYIQANEGETGLDRLRNMFSIDEFGTRSPELSFVMQGTVFGTVMGMIYGGTEKARIEYQHFIDNNQATKFTSTFEAKKKLQDRVTLGFSKGAFQWGWRLGFFTGSFILITTSIAAYRGKSSLIEYTTAGILSGACYKLSLGPRAMLTAGAAGGVLGIVAGTACLGMLKLTGTTMEEVRFWQYNWKKSRDQHMDSSIKKAVNPDTELEERHNRTVENSEVQKEETKEQSKT